MACEPQPQTDETDADTTAADTTMMMDNTIVDVAVNDGRFTTLVTAVDSTGLVETLSGPGPFTVFAPTDSAFNALPEGTVADLIQPEGQDQLRNILLYHVASGSVMAADVVAMDSVETMQGSMLPVTVSEDGTVMVGEATVVATDVQADNGVIHVIDGVLMPPSDM
ncbi:MAG: fasciclin domain-containing protein [Bacteroidetes bacterium]|nr:fasciclin domain-containing protein [Bacteroidota bacterium]